MELTKNVNPSEEATNRLEGNESAGMDLPHSEISVFELLLLLLRRKDFVLRFTLVGFVLSVLAAFFWPPLYTAKTVLLPPQSSGSITSAMLAQMGGSSALASVAGRELGVKNPSEMYVSMLQTQFVEDAIIQRFELQKVYWKRRVSDTRTKLEDRSTISSNSKDGLIYISVEDRDPKRAMDIANEWGRQMQRLSSSLALTEAGQRRLMFEKQLAEAKDNLAHAEDAFTAQQQKSGLIEADAQAKLLISSAATLQARINMKEVEIRSLKTYQAEGNSNLQQAEQELETMRSQLAQIQQKTGSTDDLLISKKQVPGAYLEYVRRLRDVKYYEAVFEALAKQVEIAKIDQAKEGALVQVVDPAVLPDKKSFPRFRIFVPVGTILALLFACLAVFISEFYLRTIDDPLHSSQIRKLRNELAKPFGS